MNRVERFLKHLANGEWHKTVPKQTGFRIVEASIDLGLVRKKLIPISKNIEDGWRGLFKITGKGKQMLKTGKYPNPKEISTVIRRLW